MKSDVRKARLYGGKKLKCQKDGPWLCLNVPFRNPDMLASVIELDIEGEIDVDGQLALDPSVASELSTVFAETGSCNLAKQSWMDKFGEWKFKHRVKDLRTGSYMTWNIEVKEAGWYDVDVEIKSDAFVNLQLDVDGKPALLDKQKSAGSYAWKRLGWVKFDRPGVHTVSLKSLQEAPEANIASLRFNPVKAVE